MKGRSSLLLCALLAGSAVAQIRSEPQPLPYPPAIEEPRDIAFPGVMRIHVDATDLAHRIFSIRQTIPVGTSNGMTLLYPKWIPGAHAAVGPLYNFAGLRISAGGNAVKWTRDPVDVYAYRLEVPPDVRELVVEAQYLTPTDNSQGGVAMTKEMLRLNWYSVLLYPAGYFARRIPADVSVTLPQGFKFASALEIAAEEANLVRFKTVSLETLLDSPLFAGKYFRKIDLDPSERSRVSLNIVADEPAFLEVKEPVVQIHRELIRQADKLFGARHFDHYDFLLSLSEKLAPAGIEHQRSSDNGTATRYFTAWDSAFISRDLLPHEYAHSWNGKYRRPADLWTANFNVPMRASLLWVYEGQTQYWGQVLAARAGFLRKEQALDALAATAATYDNQVGRTWRTLQDTTNDPVIANRRALPWRTWQRSEDYYSEGQLIWLDADTLIRERSNGKRSLDDFARAFFGLNDGDFGQLTYTLEDVVAALNRIEVYDWSKFFAERLEQTSDRAPLDGLRRGGYRLVYAETQSDYARAVEARRKYFDFSYSLGLSVDSKGNIESVVWNGPAFKSDLTAGTDIVAVNGIAFDIDKLKLAVKATKDGQPVELLVRGGENYRSVRIDYHGGARYPKLERIKDTPAVLDDILARRK